MVARSRLSNDSPRIVRHLPVMEMDRAAHHQVLPFWHRSSPEGRLWSGGDATPALERLEGPVLQAGGWYDPFLASTLLSFTGPDRVWNASGPERARRLVVGPWRHGGNSSSKTDDALNLRFAAHVLGGERGDAGLPAPLRVFVMGENRRRDEREWRSRGRRRLPLFRERRQRQHANGDGRLTWTKSASAPPDRSIPYPPVAGTYPAPPRTSHRAFDQREIEQRKDVLVYTPGRSASPSRSPDRSRSLWASSDASDTDFTAKLVDVAQDGTAIDLADGAVRARYRDSVTAPTLIEPAPSTAIAST